MNSLKILSITQKIAFAVLFLASTCTFLCSATAHASSFPATQKEETIAEDFVETIELYLSNANVVSASQERFFEACATYLARDTLTEDDYTKLNDAFSLARVAILKVSYPFDDTLSMHLRSTPLSFADLKAMSRWLKEEQSSKLISMQMLNTLLNPLSKMPRHSLRQLLKEERAYAQEDSQCNVYLTMGLLAPLSPEAEVLEKFRAASILAWAHLPFLETTWTHDEDFCKSRAKQSFSRLDALVNKKSIMVGEMNSAYNQDKANLKKTLLNAGHDPKFIEEFFTRLENISFQQMQMEKIKAQLEATKVKIAQSKERARKKFAPLRTDEPELLWGKFLRFLSLDMPDDAIDVLNVLHKKKEVLYSDKVLHVARQFVLQKTALDIKGGVLVFGFQPPATSHPNYNVGDIIVFVEDKPCRYNDERPKSMTGKKVAIYRLQPDDTFKFIVIERSEGKPLVGTFDLMESP